MFKYAIIGFGGLGKLHLANLLMLQKERGDFKLQAICGADPKSFKESVKLNLGTVEVSEAAISDCHFYQDYKDLLDNERLDFVLSTLPTYLHEEVALYALNRGIHVFSEKPMALTAEGCENMIAAAKRNGRKLMIGQCLRFDPIFRKIKEYIENQTFGKIYRAEFSRYSPKPTWSWNNWLLEPEKSGGCVLDMHIHDVDLINWFFGTPNMVRSAITEKKVEHEAIFTQYFYDDLLVTSHADWSMPATFPFEAKSIFNFEEATVVVCGNQMTVYTESESFVPPLSGENHFMEEMRAFLDFVIDDVPCPVASPESVYASVKLALAEIESANYKGQR